MQLVGSHKSDPHWAVSAFKEPKSRPTLEGKIFCFLILLFATRNLSDSGSIYLIARHARETFFISVGRVLLFPHLNLSLSDN